MIPQGVGVHATVSQGLGNVTMPPSYVRNDKTYTSPDYATATNKIDIQINGGVGNVQVKAA